MTGWDLCVSINCETARIGESNASDHPLSLLDRVCNSRCIEVRQRLAMVMVVGKLW